MWNRRRESKPGGKRPTMSRRRRLLIAAIGLLLLVLFSLTTIATLWTDLLWYQELGFEGVFWTRIEAWAAVAAAAGLIFAVIFFINLYLARRLSPKIRVMGRVNDEEIVELVPLSDRRALGIIAGVTAVFTLLFALGAGSTWRTVLLYLNQVDFGYEDPLFGLDASFFVFTLPLLEAASTFLWMTLLLTILGTAAVYVFDQAVSIENERSLKLAPHVKGHLSVLAALALLLVAFGYVMDAWRLDFSLRGVSFGASYTDVNAQLPVLYILAAVAAVSALILLVNIYYRGWRLPAAAIALLAVVWLLAGQIYPAFVQQYQVSPNEIEAEDEYIASNIEATRFAYGLERVTVREFSAEETLEYADVTRNAETIDNIRLWDPRPALDTYSQLQELRIYYDFQDVDIDRYDIDGNYRQVLVAAREMNQSQLQAQAQTWVNQHLTYTHGYGVVASPVNEVRGEGLPVFFVQDIPPRSVTDLEITQPAIYYGEAGADYVLVRTTAREFDYPQGDQNVYVDDYSGRGGVSVASLPRQAAFALRFGTLKLMLSEYLTEDSRLMYRRTLQERVPEAAPFLQYDRDPYMVVRADGSLAWIWDAYTTTDYFPYSQPRSAGYNYIRNSVKVVVDAFNGDVTYYLMDEADAVANTWANVFPDLFTPGSEMPDDLRAHIRYPEDLFTVQSEVLSLYHMQDPQVFYNKEDAWEIPMEQYAGETVPVVPYYVIMGLPGGQGEEFLLLRPFTPLQKQNMISWLGGRSDGENYGELVLFSFPKDKLIYGPAQVEARISNDPAISEQVTLWDQAGSRVIRGNLLVIPIEDSILYVEPLYLQAEQSPIPELKRVIVSYGDRVVMAEDLQGALEDIFDQESPPATVTTATPGTTTTEPGDNTTTEPGATTTTEAATTGTTVPGGELPSDVDALIALADQHYQAAEAAQREGDWTTYGEETEALGQVLERLQTLAGSQG